MRFPEALYYAMKIQKQYPEYILCGSVALILAGKIKVRDVHDLDFVTSSRLISKSEIEKRLLKTEEYINEIENDDYTCYVSTYNSCHKFNLFFFEETKSSAKTIDMKIKIQDPDDIMKWKKKYNRPKDKKDIKESKDINISQFLNIF
jgi:hypothetical protein